MSFDPSEDQALLKAAAERFVHDCVPDLDAWRAARRQPAGFAADHWRRLGESGLIGLAVSAGRGGLGGSVADLALVAEVFGRGVVPEPWLDGAVIAGGLLDAAGHAAQQAAVLERLLAGETVVALAHVERAARFDLGQVDTRATIQGDRVILDGRKTAVLAGAAAEWLIVSARDDAGIALWLVPAAATDRRVYALADGSLAAEVALHGVAVTPADRLAGGWEAFPGVVARARAVAAAEMLGAAALLFDTTLAYVKTRQQFGQPIGRFQVIQHRMTDAYMALEAMRSQVLRAALAAPADFARAAAGAFAYCADAGLAIGREAVQLHGGMGVTDELIVGHALKRLHVLALTFGDATAALDYWREAA
ncbi:hypothetical protein IP88_15270 [alpha proteobacterium AAP81b]|nr:hypothetical protein IP88_15270 [alpha proteobacterium AAP81b]